MTYFDHINAFLSAYENIALSNVAKKRGMPNLTWAIGVMVNAELTLCDWYSVQYKTT